MTDVVVVNDPSEPVVTITTPESVCTAPLLLLEVQVEVKVVKGWGITEVDVVNAPSEFVVTTTTPESVSVSPSEFVEVHVDV